MRGATTPSHLANARHSPPGLPPEGGLPGHDGPEGLSRLGDLTAPEGEVQRETGPPRCLALDSTEAGSSCGPTQESGSARESLREDGAPRAEACGTTSPPRGAAAKQNREARLPWGRTDRSQRSPRASPVTARAFHPPKRAIDPECRSDRRRSGDRCGGVERYRPRPAWLDGCRSGLALTRFERLSTQASAEALFWSDGCRLASFPREAGLPTADAPLHEAGWRADVVTEEPVPR